MASNLEDIKASDAATPGSFPASREKYAQRKKQEKGAKPIAEEEPSAKPRFPASRQAYAERKKKTENVASRTTIERSQQYHARKKERRQEGTGAAGDTEHAEVDTEDPPSVPERTARGGAAGDRANPVPVEDLEAAVHVLDAPTIAERENPRPPLLEARIVFEPEIVRAEPAPATDPNQQETEDRQGKLLISRRWFYLFGFVLLIAAIVIILFTVGAIPGRQSSNDTLPPPAVENEANGNIAPSPTITETPSFRPTSIPTNSMSPSTPSIAPTSVPTLSMNPTSSTTSPTGTIYMHNSNQTFSLIFTLDGPTGDGAMRSPSQVQELAGFMENTTSSFAPDYATSEEIRNVTSVCLYETQKSYDEDIWVTLTSGNEMQKLAVQEKQGAVFGPSLQFGNTSYEYQFTMIYASNTVNVENYTTYFERRINDSKDAVAEKLEGILDVSPESALVVRGLL
ncbi:expressed unknown protein [Seminavis robusta]|uniref:Uncharacterized protein n=1 Tax=Seminavis robusta TaxID=568900 RepID=A0A9N8DTA7_9STRA|nr:expressed unknown protein [Seminavis robusta]|eukprot:Sro341_g121420.1 n/a (455) ;mRNA; f:29950-31314